jgi:hypothetical protein
MMKTVFAFALVAMSGTALAYQPSTDAQVQPAEAEETAAPEAEVDAQGEYRAAAIAFSRCRLNARRDVGPAAAAGRCNASRKRMLAAKEALRAGK